MVKKRFHHTSNGFPFPNSLEKYIHRFNDVMFKCPHSTEFARYWVYQKGTVICSNYSRIQIMNKFHIHSENEIVEFFRRNNFTIEVHLDQDEFLFAKTNHAKILQEIILSFKEELFKHLDVSGKQADILFNCCQRYLDETISYDLFNLFCHLSPSIKPSENKE